MTVGSRGVSLFLALLAFVQRHFVIHSYSFLYFISRKKGWKTLRHGARKAKGSCTGFPFAGLLSYCRPFLMHLHPHHRLPYHYHPHHQHQHYNNNNNNSFYL